MSQEITDSNFSSIISSNKVVIIDFFANWCGPCKAIAPMIEEVSKEFEGRAIVGKLNVDVSPGVTAQFGIRNIPAFLFFKDGKLVDKQAGAGNKSAIVSKINSLL